MNREEYESIPELAGLPCYHEDSALCESLLKPMDVHYTGEVTEATSLDETRTLLSDPSYEVKGAINYTDGDSDIYRVIFWK